MSATLAVRTAEPGTLAVFGRAAAAEWTRLRTVRTTWWCLLAAAVTIMGIGATMAFDADDVLASGELPPATLAGEFGLLPGQFALLVLALLAVSQEYATGAIGPTLQWTPRRGVLLAARVAVPVLVATVAGLLLVLATDFVAVLIEPQLPLTVADLADSLGRISAVLLAGGALAVGVGLLLRSTAGALATVFLLQLVLPFLLPAFGVQWMADLGELLPGSGAIWTLIGEPEMTAAQATTLLVGWGSAALVAGGWSLLRRDAV
jgi:ABC-2 type transport system permease protein